MTSRSALLGLALFLVPFLSSSALTATAPTTSQPGHRGKWSPSALPQAAAFLETSLTPRVASPSSIDAIESVSGCGAWTVLSPDLASFKRNRHAMAYDSVHDRLLIFGGSNSEAPTYDGNVGSLSLAGATPAFSLIATTGTPPLGRQGPSMIYDASRDRIVIFGGKKSLNGSTVGPTVNEVWTLNLTGTPTWTPLTPSGTPPPDRYNHTAIYDVTRDRMIVFGGNSDALGELNDVWALSFSGTPTWTLITPSGTPPVVRENHTAIYDGPRDRMVVFGGYDASLPTPQLNDTWALSLAGSGSWSQVIANGGPPPNRYGHTAVVDASHDRMLVWSGAGTLGNLTDLWSLNLSNPIKWTQLSPSGSPPPAMVYAASVYDPVRTRMISFDQDYFFALTITQNSTSWAFLAATFPPRRAGASVIYDAPRQRLILFGGAQAALYGSSDTWAYSLSGGGWSFLGNGGPSNRQSHTAVFDPIGNRMLVFGGRGDGLAKDDVWSLSLVGTPTWTQLSPTGAAPVACYQHTAIFDVPRNRMVVYGGMSEFTGLAGDAVWALSLAGTPSWSQLNPSGGPPPARWQHSAVFDSPRNRMLVFGGYVNVGSLPADPTVWALDLASSPAWSPLPVGGGAAPVADHVAVYDPTRDAMLVAGQDLNSTQALNLSGSPSWGTLGLVAPPPPGRLGAGAAFDTGNDRWVVVSGYNGPYRNDVIALSFASTPYGLDLQVSPSGSGNVQTNPTGKCFAPGTLVTLTAFAGLGYAFSNWSGDASGSANPLNVTMDSNKSIIANFVGYPVNVTVVPTGSGTVSKSPNQTTYAPGSQVTLTANSSVPFLQWSGDASGTMNPLTITVDGPKSITATFDANTITTTVNPPGSATVTRTPNQAFYATGAEVALTATPITGYLFTSWSGDVTSTDNPVQVTVTGSLNVTANMSIPPPICGGWTFVPVTTKPVARRFAAAIWDPVRHRMVIYGGQAGVFPIGDTWALSLDPAPAWTLVASGSGGRWGVKPFYDPVRDRFVFFGGTSGLDSWTNDLWALPLGGASPAWSQIVTTGTPPVGRSGTAVIYDPLRDRMLLFGGRQRCGTMCSIYFNDVWQLTLAGTPTWTQVFPLGTPPPIGVTHGAIYDPIRDRMVILPAQGSPGEAWALSLSGTPTWTALNPWGVPFGGSDLDPLLYDPVRDRTMSMSPDGSGNVSTLDFELDPNQPLWSKNYAGGGLMNRAGASTVYDPDDDLVILFGGGPSDQNSDATFRLDFGGGYLLDAGGTNGSVVTTKWCYGAGEIATLIGAPNQGYKFSQWLGDATGTSNPTEITMDGYKVVRAEFIPAGTAVEETPITFALSVRPNPSTGPADIEYALPRETTMKLRVFDIAGREVARLVDGWQPPGRHVVRWSGTAGARLRAGIYVVRLETTEGAWSQRLAVLR